MRTIVTFVIATALAAIMIGSAVAQGSFDARPVEILMDSAKSVEAPVFAPKAFEKAQQQFSMAVSPTRTAASAPSYLAKAREYIENAIKATEVCKLSLKEYLPPRDKARAAKAYMFVPLLYDKAETQFVSATGKIESGDVKGGLREAVKSSPLFDVAEIEAIRKDVLGKTDSLIGVALLDEALKYALTTLDKAKTAREKANTILTQDRYNRKDAMVETARAEYEARHASNIAQSVRSLNRNDQAWEKLMLLYEIQMNRVGEALGLSYLPFDNGQIAAADSLIKSIRAGQSALSADAATVQDSLKAARTRVGELERNEERLTLQLRTTAGLLNADTMTSDPITLALAIDNGVVALTSERSKLSDQIAVEQNKMSQLTEQHEEVSAELQVKQEREDRLAKAKAMIDPTQGELLVNASNDIVLRLFSLSFAAGKSEITEQHKPLLDKVREIISLFPEPKLVIEGHTDDKGDPGNNTLLSEKRAFAVMQYLRQTMSIPSDQIRAIGYGSDKPIASQSTPEGRAKNRRIDIVILQ